jgi:radical SAM superfamily enzyme YgiQ (UPF0313 family)
MKIALINPANKISYGGAPPISLALLASYLRQFKHEIKIIDMASGDSILDVLEFNPEYIGITGTTLTINTAYEVADFLRKREFKVIIGGVHASIMPDEAIEHADYVVVGEGEIALKHILNNDFLYLENNEGIIQGQTIDNLDELPMPAYDLLNMEFYLKTRIPKILRCVTQERRTANILTSRGCPYNCTFCHNSSNTKKFRWNSAEKVIQEIEYLIKNYKIDNLFFIEDNFFANRERVKSICNILIEKGIKIQWGANARADGIDKEILELAKKAGCIQITFGWESGSQKMLDIYNKKTTIEQNAESIRLCNEVGIFANGTFMIGGPDETIEDIRKTKDFILNNKIMGGIGVCITTPFPGTKLWDDLKKQGKIPKNVDYKIFNFMVSPFKICDIDNQTLVNLSNNLKDIGTFKQMQYKLEDEIRRLDF